MALDFGLFGARQGIQSSDYKSAGSHQAENAQIELVTDADQYELIYTVPEGKTYYVSAILISHATAGVATFKLATGDAASEVDFLVTSISDVTPFNMAFPTPIKFSSGVKISARSGFAPDVWFILIGWEE